MASTASAMIAQKDMFTKRYRKVKAPGPTEFQIQASVVAYLRLMALPSVEWTAFPAGELRDPRTAAKLKAMGLKAGWPDLLLCRHDELNGVTTHLGLELKRDGGRLSEVQEDRHAGLLAAGWIVEVAQSLDDAIEALERHGMVRGRQAVWRQAK